MPFFRGLLRDFLVAVYIRPLQGEEGVTGAEEDRQVLLVALVQQVRRDQGEDEVLAAVGGPPLLDLAGDHQGHHGADVVLGLRLAGLLLNLGNDDDHHAHQHGDDPHYDENLDEREAGLAASRRSAHRGAALGVNAGRTHI